MNFLLSLHFCWGGVSECIGSHRLSRLKTENAAACGQGERAKAARRSSVEFPAAPLSLSALLLLDFTGEYMQKTISGGVTVSELQLPEELRVLPTDSCTPFHR